MKEVHLICNAHIDPIWQWTEDEGIFTALSTFRSAVNLCGEFDYIFCHNEVELYKYIKKYDPDLYAKIKELVHIGKWHIMGGWYLQPDCNMPCGESFVRQIMVGRKFFMEEFGKAPTVATNFDSFGHTRGLVQIMAKCGQEGYIIHRPYPSVCPIGANQFWWEGFDGSRIKVNREFTYGTALGHAVEGIKDKISRADENDDVICVLWGVGNHGGGPSRKDLRDIDKMIAEGEMKILHSTPETFFAKIDPQVVYRESLLTSMPGCYTTMSRLKAKYIELENTFYLTEKICSLAAQKGLMDYPQEKLDEAVEDLLLVEFHDVLPGTSVRSGEENALNVIGHGMKILIDLRSHALYALSREMQPAREGTYPILVFNPHPYAWETEVTCELSLADQNWDEENVSHLDVVDENGKKLPMQIVKEESNLTLDWRKKVAFRAKLNPLSINRFDVEVTFGPKQEIEKTNALSYQDDHKTVVIDEKTGLLSQYCVDGISYLNGPVLPMLFKDNADPWAMGDFQLERLGTEPQPFTLCQKTDGVFRGMKPIQVIEDGEIYRAVEAFFEKDNNLIRLEYRIYKNNPAVDVLADVFFNDADRMLKLAVPLAQTGTFVGGTAFGTQELYMDGRECVSQRFVAMKNGNGGLAVLNNCQYGSSFENGTLYLSLIRGAGYCAHPIPDRPLLQPDRFTKRIDQGWLQYSFRLVPAAENEWCRLANEFNQPPYALNVFPDATAKPTPFTVEISNKNITLEAFKKCESADGFALRLYNASETDAEIAVAVGTASADFRFGRYEVKTVLYHAEKLTECDEMII